MTSQAPCRCVNNILITYDENKAKADIQHTALTIYMRHKYYTTAAYKKKYIFLGGLVNQKSLSHNIKTL